MSRRKTTLSTISILMAAMLLLSSCGGAASSVVSTAVPAAPAAPGEQQYVEKLIVGQGTDVVSFDPCGAGDTASIKGFLMLYNRLLERDPETGEIKPALAESYEVVDEHTWKFILREGVKFHNGDTLTAEDVVFSFDRMKQGVKYSADYAAIESIEILDDHTFIMHLSETDVVLFATLAQSYSAIVSHKSMDTGSFVPIGTGPYKLGEYVTGDHITYERFDDYYLGAPKTRTIVTRIIPETTSRLIALEVGEIHVAEDVAANDISKVANNSDLTLVQIPGSGVEYVGFNVTAAPLDNKLVRQALNCATNKDELIEAVLDGAGVSTKTPVGAGVLYRYEGFPGYDYDIERAKALLAEAGYPNGLDFSILVKGSQQQLTAQVLQAQFLEVGVNLDIQFMENTAFFDALNTGNFQAGMITRNNSTGDPADSLDFFYSPNIGSAGNRWRFSNARFDELYKASSSETDTAKREAMFIEMQEIIGEECPWICMFTAMLSVGTTKGVQGIHLSAAKQNNWSTIYLEK